MFIVKRSYNSYSTAVDPQADEARAGLLWLNVSSVLVQPTIFPKSSIELHQNILFDFVVEF